MSLAAGRLRHRLRLEEYVDVLDSNGEPIPHNTDGTVQAWQLVREVRGAIEPLSIKAFIAVQSQQSKVIAHIVIRRTARIDPSMRFVHGSTVYHIEGILADRESGREYITCPVSQGLVVAP